MYDSWKIGGKLQKAVYGFNKIILVDLLQCTFAGIGDRGVNIEVVIRIGDKRYTMAKAYDSIKLVELEHFLLIENDR